MASSWAWLRLSFTRGRVGALLLSYLNDSISSNKNLAPEDVEYILQRSALDVDSLGYDLLTGFGRLNAGHALALIDTAKRKLHHFDSDSVTHSFTVAQVQTGIPIRLRERTINLMGQKFDHKVYSADIFKVTCNMSLTLSINDSILSSWPRHSSSDFYMYDGTDSLLPHQKIQIENITSTSATVSGYIFRLYDSISNTHRWFPTDTGNISSMNFAISVLTGDSIPIWNYIQASKKENSTINVYPNPTNSNTTIEVETSCHEKVKLLLYSMQGQVVQPIFEGVINDRQRFICNTDYLNSGLYWVSLQSPCGNNFIKFIKL